MMNSLNLSPSPYLQQHATNPVNWQCWSLDILEQARTAHKPILVSIGYSTCHWCHVMAHESFEDHLTAEIMNEHFINVKIDREERPDLDHYFMNAVQAMGISGGWPLHCFLTEDGDPFFGGTYFPPEPKYGRPSWNQVLMSVAQAYRDKHRELFEQAVHLASHLESLNRLKEEPHDLSQFADPSMLLKQLLVSADREEGGFGSAPKFPHIQALQLLLQLYYQQGNHDAANHALKSLKRMAAGGLFDQLEGGFCRYSVDAGWNVPHFEKMLYDHAQICEGLFQAYHLSRDPFLIKQAERSLVFFETNMRDPCGYFYAAMDADSEGEEGKYYVWEQTEIEQLLRAEISAFKELYTFSPLDHMHPHKKVLRIHADVLDSGQFLEKFDKLEGARRKLAIQRNQRVHPSIDQKGIIAWNAMMVSTYAEAYRYTLNPDYKSTAIALLNTLQQLGFHGNGYLCRYLLEGQPQAYGFLEDYCFLVKAMMDCYQISFEPGFLQSAKTLFWETANLFKSADSPLLKMSSEAHTDFNKVAIDWAESTYPNGNVIICQSARYLYQMTGETAYKDFYSPMLQCIGPFIAKYPLATASWAMSLLQEQSGNPHIKGKSAEAILEKFENKFIPGLLMQADETLGNSVVVCLNQVCSRPLNRADEMDVFWKDYWTQW